MGKKPPRQQQGQNSSSAAPAGGGSKPNASGRGGAPGPGGEGKKGGGGGDRSGEIRLRPDGKPVLEKPASLFGSWTGKTPLSLLHEFCQKQKWNKPGIQPRRVENGFVTTIHLSKRTKTGEVLNVRFTPPDRTGPSAALANHWAATYALHRVNSRVSMHHALPPEHRDYWQTLEKARKEEGQAGEWKYAADPFTAKPPPPPARGEGGRRPQRSASPSGHGGPGRWGSGGSGGRTLASSGEPDDRSAQEAAAAREKRHWEALPMVHMSAETRQLVEQVVRDFFREAASDDSTLPEADDDGETISRKPVNHHLRNNLVRMGFRPEHVAEALTICSDQTSALDWLCLNVPEDDLPRNFLQNTFNPEVTSTRHDTESLAIEYATQRLSSVGFAKELCKTTLEQHDGNEMAALQALLERLTQIPFHAPDHIPAEVADLWEEEATALKAIYDKRINCPSPRAVIIDLRFGGNRAIRPPSQLEIRVPEGSAYPYAPPLALFRNPHLPAYIRLSITRALNVAATGMVGTGMVFSLVEWAEENVPRLAASPPSLKTLTEGLHRPSPGPKVAAGEKPATPAPLRKQESGGPGLPLPKKGTSGGNGRKHTPLKRIPEVDRILLQSNQMKRKNAEFVRLLGVRENLPSFAFKQNIVDCIMKNQVTIVSGETGCGKTTQVPQFILDALIDSSNGSLASIVCTQPRRISAIGIADRVAAERCENVGRTVGYAIRGESKQSKDTRLLFCTTGLLLRRLVADPALVNVSHVIVDEVHERTIESDFLLVILRAALALRKDLRVVLMSATLDATSFSTYFNGAPCVSIPGRTFPVETLYIEDIIRKTGCAPPEAGSSGGYRDRTDDHDMVGGEVDEATASGEEAIRNIEKIRGNHSDGKYKIDYKLISVILRWIDDTAHDDGEGAVLIFLPGVMEIKRCVDQIRSLGKRFEVWPLHSGLTSQEQSNVFRAPVQGYRKVVVSTNVAETSITIDGIVHVIDSGRVKQLQYEVTNHMLRLEETWASRASCKQRQGRAGRTRPGVCYKLYTRRMEERVLPAKTPPEILRTPLEQLCLQVKAMGHNDVKAFLSQAIDPPSTEAMDTAIGILRAFGATDPDTGKLTAMGRHMAAIPADIRISKMLIYGSVFHCLRPMLTIAACLSSKSPFMSPMEKREEAKAARDKFATGKSDLLTAAAAYDAWDRIRKTVSRSELRQFCESNFLSTQTLFEIYDLRRQYLDLLRDLGFAPWKSKGQAKDDEDRLNANSANLKLVKAAICAGLYPNVARIQHPKTTYEQSLHGSIAVDPEARQIKFFTKEDGRIFLHPSTVGFSINKYEEPFLVYFSKIATSKVFLRDATPVGAYPLLLFGGRLTVDHHARGIWIDGKVALRAWARIAVLVNQLRKALDRLLDVKVEDPTYDVSSSPVIETMVRLIATDGGVNG